MIFVSTECYVSDVGLMSYNYVCVCMRVNLCDLISIVTIVTS